jgi:hypothetical protein
MAKLTALSPELHKHFKIDTDRIEAQGAHERLVPVVIAEFSKLVVQYPVVFTKSEESGEFLCAAVLGFEPKENLFWQESWRGIYTPLNVLRQPFFVGNEIGDNVVCIDEHAKSVSLDRGEALFDEEGRETTFLADIKKMLAQLLNAEEETKKFIRVLLSYDLLVAMPLEITFANGEARSIRGFYTIDEAKLNNLTEEKLVSLQQAKYLSPIYIMIASLGHFYSLIQMKNTLLTKRANN